MSLRLKAYTVPSYPERAFHGVPRGSAPRSCALIDGACQVFVEQPDNTSEELILETFFVGEEDFTPPIGVTFVGTIVSNVPNRKLALAGLQGENVVLHVYAGLHEPHAARVRVTEAAFDHVEGSA